MGREDLIGRRPKARTLQPISACALPADRRHISTDVTAIAKGTGSGCHPLIP